MVFSGSRRLGAGAPATFDGRLHLALPIITLQTTINRNPTELATKPNVSRWLVWIGVAKCSHRNVDGIRFARSKQSQLRAAVPAKIALGAGIGFVDGWLSPRPFECASRHSSPRHVGPPGRASAGAAVAVCNVNNRTGRDRIGHRTTFALASDFHGCVFRRASAFRRDPRLYCSPSQRGKAIAWRRLVGRSLEPLVRSLASFSGYSSNHPCHCTKERADCAPIRNHQAERQ